MYNCKPKEQYAVLNLPTTVKCRNTAMFLEPSTRVVTHWAQHNKLHSTDWAMCFIFGCTFGTAKSNFWAKELYRKKTLVSLALNISLHPAIHLSQLIQDSLMHCTVWGPGTVPSWHWGERWGKPCTGSSQGGLLTAQYTFTHLLKKGWKMPVMRELLTLWLMFEWTCQESDKLKRVVWKWPLNHLYCK